MSFRTSHQTPPAPMLTASTKKRKFARKKHVVSSRRVERRAEVSQERNRAVTVLIRALLSKVLDFVEQPEWVSIIETHPHWNRLFAPAVEGKVLWTPPPVFHKPRIDAKVVTDPESVRYRGLMQWFQKLRNTGITVSTEVAEYHIIEWTHPCFFKEMDSFFRELCHQKAFCRYLSDTKVSIVDLQSYVANYAQECIYRLVRKFQEKATRTVHVDAARCYSEFATSVVDYLEYCTAKNGLVDTLVDTLLDLLGELKPGLIKRFRY